MSRSDGGIPDYEARCTPSSLSFIYRPRGATTRETVDIDARELLADGCTELLIAWASLQKLAAIESILISLDKRFEAFIAVAEKASAAAVARMPDPMQLLEMIQAGMRPPRVPTPPQPPNVEPIDQEPGP